MLKVSCHFLLDLVGLFRYAVVSRGCKQSTPTFTKIR